jgi:hypothetical protein
MKGGGTKYTTLDPYAGTGVRELYQALNSWVTPTIGQGATPYSGSTVSGASPLQTQGFDLASLLGGQAGNQFLSNQNLSNQYMNEGGSTLKSLLQPYDPNAATAMWNKAYVDPAMQLWKGQTMPGIMEQAERMGGTASSGGMQRELALAGENMSTDLASQLAKLQYQGQQDALSRQQTAVNQAGQYAQLPGQISAQNNQSTASIINSLLNTGSTQRGITNDQLQESYQKWQYSQPSNNPMLSVLKMALGQPEKTIQASQQSDPLGQLLSGFGTLMGTSGGVDSLMGNISSLAALFV